MTSIQRVTAVSYAPMALTILISLADEAASLYPASMGRKPSPRVLDASTMPLMVLSVAIDMCCIFDYHRAGLEFSDAVESQNWCLKAGAVVGSVVGGYLLW